MPPSEAERKIRSQLPMVRFMQDHMPLSLTHWMLKQGVKRVQLPAGVTRQAVLADGVPCAWIIPEKSSPDRVLLYLHGGGFVMGLTPQHMQMVAYMTQKMGLRALMVDYRLAPAHPFPAALDDCVTAYRWLLKQGIAAQNMVMAGDSAGGNLTLTSLLKLRDEGDPLPAAAACLSPVADLAVKDHLFKQYKEPLLPRKSVNFYSQSYAGQDDIRNPLISPVYGDWRGLPPLLIHVGEEEILCDDAKRVEQLARAAGVDVRLEIYPRMWHVWQIFLALPEAVQSLDDITSFLNLTGFKKL